MRIIINPTAGNGLARRVGNEIIKALQERGIQYEAALTEYPGHATELAHQAALQGAGTVIALGGDGTVLEVARGLYGTDAALGIIPAGTGNDVVKMLKTPARPLDALSMILEGKPKRLDAGRINDSLFLNVTGTGFDVVVLTYAESAKKYVRGMLPYLWGVLRTILHYQPTRVRISIDGETPLAKDVLLVAVANGRFIGGGIQVAPDASPSDGLFDIVIIDSMPRWKMPRHLPKLLTGKIREIPGTYYTRGRGVMIEGEGLRMNIDGEIVPVKEARMEILPGALWAYW